MTAVAPQPIGDAELERLLGPALESPSALAVSGGADSVALLHLVARTLARPAFNALRDDPRGWVRVLTVDHCLRPESAAEAAIVKAEAERLGFAHETLVWQGEKPSSGVQAAAREARYALMTAAILREHANGGPHRSLITAHHAGDQAETLIMRLARGSGASGLAAMRAVSDRQGVTLHRPLLGVPKSRLIATLETAGVKWIEDPSNSNDDFERIRVRRALAHLAALGIGDEKLALSARRIARADLALDHLTTQLGIAAGLSHHSGAFASLDLSTFRDGEAEARVRLLGRLIAAHGGQEAPPRLSQLEDLDQQIRGAGSNSPPPSGMTAGGCSVRWNGERGQLQFFREAGRKGLPEVLLLPGQSATWDRRFKVTFKDEPAASSGGPIEPVSVRALGEAAYATLRSKLSRDIPALAGATLPAFFRAGELRAVPYFRLQAPLLAGPGRESCAVFEAEGLIGASTVPY